MARGWKLFQPLGSSIYFGICCVTSAGAPIRNGIVQETHIKVSDGELVANVVNVVSASGGDFEQCLFSTGGYRGY